MINQGVFIKGNCKKAQTLLYVGFVFLIVAMIAALVMTSTTNKLKVSRQQGKGAEAYQLAQAGLELAKVGLNSDWNNWTMDIGDDNIHHRGEVGLDETKTLGEGQYWVRVEDVGTKGVRLISHGWFGDSHRIVVLELENQAAAASSAGLVAYYKFENNVIDETGNNNGVNQGATFVSGQINQAASFDGSNDYVDVANDPTITTLSALTISSWIYPVAGIADYDIIVNKENEYETAWSSNGLRSAIRTDTNGWWWTAGTGAGHLPLNQWTHVVTTWDGAQIKEYINGVLQLTSNQSGNTTRDSGSPLRIGRRSSAAPTYHWRGSIDEVKIWNRALSSREISELFFEQGGQAAGLVVDYPFEGSATDASPNGGHDGTVIGATFTNGKCSQAASLDGNDYISISDALDLRFGLRHSFGGWIYATADPGDWARIIGKGSSGARNYGLWRFTSGGMLCQWLMPGWWCNCWTNAGATIIPYNQWHHAMCVFDYPWARLYVDGQEVHSCNCAGTPVTSADPLTVGYAGYHQYFRGSIDQVKLYDRALSGAEVQALVDQDNSCEAGDGLVAYYPFDGNTSDLSGAGNDGTPQNGASFVAGKVNQAVSLDGNNDYVSVNNFGSFATMTVSAWIYRTSATATRESIVSYKEGDGVSQGFVLCLNENGSSQYPRIYVQVNGVWRAVEQAVAIPLNTWVHLAASYDGSSIVLYRNGAQVASGNYAGSMTNTGSQTTGIGTRASLNTHYFPGQIDEVKIWSLALDADEIKAEFIAGNNGPIAYYPFEDNWDDLSGIGNHGTPVGNPSFAVGKIGRAADLDGNDYINLGVANELNLTDNFTVSAWFNARQFSNYGTIISRQTYPYNGGWGLVEGSAIFSFIAFQGASYQYLYVNANPPVNEWHHLAVVVHNGTRYTYLDGVQQSATDTFPPTQNPGAQAVIGRFYSNYNNYYFNGLIDEVKVWNRALSVSEIIELASASQATTTGIKPVSGTWGER
ncbi:MAG: LamG domain-containing protein [Candidatus Omnitrophica bacterium]|nr:LamG domain-containing protein [Candidatus Omnitrophota bacterium]